MTNGNAPPFDLITEPWLPVLLADGSASEWGLAELFARAHEARGLSEPSPLTYTAVLRTLLAILHRAMDGPKMPHDWAEMYRAGRFDSNRSATYLAQWQDRFDLYHPERPFAQVDSTVVIKGQKPVSQLLLERSCGNNPTLFDHSYDANPPTFSPAEAARALLTAQAYGFSGTGGFKQSTMVKGYAVTFEGSNFFETLLLNLFGYDDRFLNRLQLRATDDSPWWEWATEPLIAKPGNQPRGLTDLLTWRSRQIRLLPEPNGHVRWVKYAPGYALSDPDLTLRDPCKRYTKNKSGEYKGAYTPQDFSPGRSLWRDVDALIEHAGLVTSPDDPNQIPEIVNWVAMCNKMLAPGQQVVSPSIIATGLVNNKAKAELWRMDRLPLTIELLEDPSRQAQVKSAINDAEAICNALILAGSAYACERINNGTRKPDESDIARERATLNLDARYWSHLERLFQIFLVRLASTEEPGPALDVWHQQLERSARKAFDEATVLDPTQYRAWVAGNSELNRRLSMIGWTSIALNSEDLRRKARDGNAKEAPDAVQPR